MKRSLFSRCFPRTNRPPSAWLYDNAKAERFMRTLKEEEVDGRAYRDLDHARDQIGPFLEQVYNRQRLHSALDYLTPEEYETKTKPGPAGSIPLAPAPIQTCP